MGENKKKTLDIYEKEERFKVVTVEVDYESVGVIEKLIKQQPELGYNNVEGYLEGLFLIKGNETSDELKKQSKLKQL